jgi:hypothetical protein
MRLDVWVVLKGPYRAKPFHDRSPGAALEDSLAPGWYVHPFQGTELRFERTDSRPTFLFQHIFHCGNEEPPGHGTARDCSTEA